MAKTIRILHTSHCPYLNRVHSIYINYFEIPMAGKTSHEYKKEGYSCEYNNCTSRDSVGRCPVFLEAPENPR